MARLQVAAVLVALAACEKAEPPGTESTNVAALEQRVLTLVDANRVRHCVRPVLRGTASEGPAASDQLAFTEPGGALAECVAAMREYRNLKPTSKRVVDANDPKAIEVDGKCGMQLESVLAAAVSHTDACSTYQTGVHALPLLPALFQLLHAVGLRAARRGDSGDVASALKLLADGVRLQQDMTRGHASLAVATLARAGENVLLTYADTMAAAASATVAQDVIPLFDALIASEPDLSAALAGETEALALHLGLARTKPSSWQPPGGIDVILTTPGTGTAADRNAGVEVMNHALKLRDIFASACPEGRSLAMCRARLIPLRPAIDGLSPMFADSLDEELKMLATTVAHLAEVRLALQVAADARCPSARDLASPGYTARVTPRGLGDTLRVTASTAALEVAPPGWANRKNATWTIRCP